ncbi:MAG: ammonium transporter [Pelagibacteraceae bacterium]|jgi:Amt family ammonium transporter|nr:ammonium transporter [Pelagibacteraceae bacterium]MBO6470565.1 ammonium transporter [Pelagibacteraceae bacterium]MBO6471368.1 ammonium transporter [Pelagibacteraceae bacterium]MDP6784113.1 ammonium transporter [Alphaproteobacteria bacterium]|tara:strand:- start:653 stop:1936 length:1284 start_codon:yes stop_codon:yes gene_type:complete
MSKKKLYFIGTLISFLFLTSVARAEVSEETAYILNTFLFLVMGFLVMWMAAGFCMLESGLVTSKSVSTIAAKNIGLYAIAGIAFWVCGYNLAYGIPEGGFIGSFIPWSDASSLETGYSDGSDWFFQMVFCATTCSIVSGTLAERIKIWPFFVFAAILAAIIYPIEMGWQWGGGFLSAAGFSDFAGSTLVHSAGGSAALAGAILLGPRLNRFTNGESKPLEPFAASSIPLATLGVFVLWLGWFGFNGGSQLALGSFEDANAIGTIFINTNLAACGGVVVNALLTRFLYGKTDVIQMLNGALGGLVAITAEPLMPSPFLAIIIGGIGGAIVVFGSQLLAKLKIDDVVGAIPVHLFAGIWGTLAVVLSNPDASLGSQIIGILSVNIFVFVVSFVVWYIMKKTAGIRISQEAEKLGTDKVEIGVVAYMIRD